MMKFLLLLVSALFFIEGSLPINADQEDQQLYIATQLTRIFFVSYKK